MIDVTNIENFESGNAEITGIVIQEFKVNGPEFDKLRAELKEIFEKYRINVVE
ncbi:hypothetical protein [Methanococcus maripaludis]|jgi:hypothetical protein|uniref:Uncharacterized protein n=1 Tax=Methanococcus maripaludis TaxID=39152 RepID=A0A7J9PCH8_METMI|nr:hypothetical protein [Methanococcus maripaludis]MBA2852996.1 hypothetical protein [Methanococcus maripaludis]MBA2860953.1 hypothetical protein [Methanococcus maripaludis]